MTSDSPDTSSLRLDAALAARGHARSRTHAATLISAGEVSIDGVVCIKASTRVGASATLDVASADHYVSRAAHKLLAGLDAFDVAVEDRVALDLGASTGGFTQVLRERGAAQVLAVDVGHGQISATIAHDPRVCVVEGFNVRFMTKANLAEASGSSAVPSLVTGDLSFISLTYVVAAIAEVMAPDGDALLLVKPQFEVGRTAVKGGLVTDPALRADAVMTVLWAAWDAGLSTRGIVGSPIAGTHGNREYVVHLRPNSTGNPTQWMSKVNEVTGAR